MADRSRDSSVPAPPREVGVWVATFIVVANMVGTGVFTSLGFQLVGLKSPFVLLMLWLVGGLHALCGAFSYGELAAAMPHSGGEYHFLSRIYHPAVGFLAGWVSITVGFAAPIAAAAMALGTYLSCVFPLLPPRATALVVTLIVSMIHLRSAKTRGGFQVFFTVFKLVLIAGLIGCGLVLATPQPVTWWPTANDLWSLSSAPFAVSLVYVTYSYSGWNASVYLANEVREPERNIPRSLLAGTLVVIVLYLLLNFVFLYSTPASVLTGQLQVGFLAAEHIFGPSGARVAGLLISFGLVSAVSSMTWAGPRVVSAVGEDVRFLRPFAALNGHGVPQRALFLQTLIVITLILTSTFEQLITYLGFTLAASTFLAVVGVFVIRRRLPDADRPFKAWGYPVTQLFFLAVTGWMLVYLLYFRPFESLAGLATLILGLVVYFAAVRGPQPASPFGPSEERSGLLDQDAGR